MKKTCFLAMLAAALMGEQVFAEPTGTGIDGAEPPSESKYYGSHTTSESETATGGNVTIKKDPAGEVPASAIVYGGYADKADVSNNTVTMQGGTVLSIYGGNGSTGASKNKVTMQGGDVSNFIYGGNGGTEGNSYNNTVIMTGGSVKAIYGGASGINYTVSGNVVIVTGGSITSALCAGNSTAGVAQNNKVHLVGKGASNVNIADAQGNSVTYNGSNVGITLNNVLGGSTTRGTSTDNSIDIYGTGIKISGMFAYMQVLTFNITNDVVVAQTPEVAVNLTSQSSKMALDLTGVDLQVKDLDVKEWTPGKTITLVQSEQEINGIKSGKAVNIMKDGKAVALGKLVLSGDNKTLSLIVQGNVPEPATSTLSLLALATLAARRRRK